MKSDLPPWLEWIAWSVAAVSAVLYVAFATNGFWGDDWELRAQAVRGVSLLSPISSHIRPMVRALFMLLRWTESPLVFHLLSIALHLLTAVAAYALTKRMYSPQTGRVAALCFFAAFPANEAVYWTSAAGVILCLMFSLLALHAWGLDRPMVAALLLVPAALSYELWLVAIPLCFFMRRGRLRDWLPVAAVFLIFVLSYLGAFGSEGASAYGGWKWAAIPERLSIYAYHVFAPRAESVGAPVALLLVALIGAAAWVPTLRWPVGLYASSTLVLALAETRGAISRFCYFPQLALILIFLLMKETGRVGRWLGIALLLYLMVVSPFWNFVDGRDYRELADFYTEAGASTKSALASASAGDSFGFLNQTTPDSLIEVFRSFRGRPKAAYVRATALYGAIYLPDVVALELYARGLVPKANDNCGGKRFELGDGRPLARYCFDVISSEP